MSTLEIIDEKNFIIKYNEPMYRNKSFSHLFCEWTVKYQGCNGDRFVIGLHCNANDSNLWKVTAEVTYNFIRCDGTKGEVEMFDVTYQADDTQLSNEVLLIRKEYSNKKTSSIECNIHVKIKAIIGFPYKMHDFTKSDDIINNTVLIVEGKKLYVSKQVLAMASPVFHAMFYSNFKESTDEEIAIGKAKYEYFEQFLQLTYGCYVKIGVNNVDELLQLADQFNVDDVKTKCEDSLMANQNNTERNLILSEKYSLSRLQNKIINSLEVSQLSTFCRDNKKFGESTIRAVAKKFGDKIRRIS